MPRAIRLAKIHPVGQRVVDLGHHRNPVIGQSLDEIHLPQRVLAVQLGAGDLPDRLVEFATATRCGQPPRPDVVLEIDLAMLAPHRVVELERNVDQLIAQRFQLAQPAADDLSKRVDTEAAAVLIEFDDGGLDGVHVHVRCLAVKQYRVPAGEPFHHSPLVISATLQSARSQMTSLANCVRLRCTWLRNSEAACAIAPARGPSIRSKPWPAPGSST